MLKFSSREAEEVFGKGKYNHELFQYALNKVFNQELILRKRESLENDNKNKYTRSLFNLVDLKTGAIFLLVAISFLILIVGFNLVKSRKNVT